MWLALLFLAISGFFVSLSTIPADAASFNCAKASTPDERAICADAGLSLEDEKLAGLYTRLDKLLDGAQREELTTTQHEWLQTRAKCQGDLACLVSTYDRRTKQLQNRLAEPDMAALDLFRRTGQCKDCNLSGANFTGIDPAAFADDAELCAINAVADGIFDGARIDHANFVSCNTKDDSALSTMTWDGASLKGTDFTGANLGGNSFKGANLTGANLSDANLFWVDMSNATLRQANLTGAQSGSDLMGSICSNFNNADFSDAKLEKAKLCGGFYNANLTGANLRNATIFGIAMGISKRAKEAAYVEIAPPDTDPKPSPGRFGGKINLTGADLRGATIFSETKLTPHGYGFAILCRTKMPDGTTSNRDCK